MCLSYSGGYGGGHRVPQGDEDWDGFGGDAEDLPTRHIPTGNASDTALDARPILHPIVTRRQRGGVLTAPPEALARAQAADVAEQGILAPQTATEGKERPLRRLRSTKGACVRTRMTDLEAAEICKGHRVYFPADLARKYLERMKLSHDQIVWLHIWALRVRNERAIESGGANSEATGEGED